MKKLKSYEVLNDLKIRNDILQRKLSLIFTFSFLIIGLILVLLILFGIGKGYNILYNGIFLKGEVSGYEKCSLEKVSEVNLSTYEYIDMTDYYRIYTGNRSSIICTEPCSYLDLSLIGGGWITNNGFPDKSCWCYIK